MREDNYRINLNDPAIAFKLDIKNIKDSSILLALLDSTVSAGVQTEIGVAIALKKKVVLAHSQENDLAYFNSAMLQAHLAQELHIPFNVTDLKKVIM